MRLIDADVLLDNIRRDSKKAIDEGDKVGSFWLGYAAGSVIAQPTIQPIATDTNVGDTISRRAAIRWVKTECNPYGKPTLEFESGKKVIEHLEQMPPAQPEPKEGHWIEVAGELECSECHTVFTDLYPDYADSVACPHCGTKMRGGQNG